MERLTIIDGCGNDELARCMNCGLGKAGENLENCGMCEEGWQRALRRLAAYEDTGLEPEQVMELKSFTQGGIHKADDGWKHVQELLQAEKEGRLVVLPCKVGDAAYWLHNGIITECRVHRIQMNRTGMFICLKSKVSHGAFRVDTCLGKTVFLTREEAEAALAQKGGED